ncbi:hypothetical protein L596_020116 [Steinernema carpocapsae]|uniref:Uncharacterized protein n=1 Tax=Steinernema carpocapsae TaxID=34508 RepID=A0A4V6A0T2_STECR|nr:hypothetical protein L596_020116 [Steinernema carpocapsae]
MASEGDSSASSSSPNADRLLKTDDLHHLKEGEIFIDEDGKKYRVKKTIMPHYSSEGPHGMGDPNDRTLRRLEADVIIPNRMNKRIEAVECHDQFLNMIECQREHGAIWGWRNANHYSASLTNAKPIFSTT